MTPKERIAAAINGQEHESPPSFYMGTAPINREIARKKGITQDGGSLDNQVAVSLGADIVFVRPAFTAARTGKLDGFRVADAHAAIHKEKGTQNAAKVPLAEINSPDQIHDVNCWPDPDDYTYTLVENDLQYCSSHGVVARGNGALFLSAVGLRGMEQFMMDMALNPELCHEILGKITRYFAVRIDRFLETSGEFIDIVDIGDDVAGQAGMLFSLEMWREFVKPYIEELVAVIKKHGKKALYFGCGGFRVIIPDFIDMGIDCAGRMQTEAAGNNIEGLKADFGDKICIWGALDAQHRVIEGSEGDVREHVSDVVRAAAPGGRFVAGPTHTFTEDTPVENILSVYKQLKL
ncbi:MAG: hypothetical protein HN368_06730 [Spirochaetales bacterium]|mgnify:CR=1 FL=1|jgi:uroporphyrinogen decarboxylase|nr:hypothetical protein [Spirochaetales bacterium]